MDHHRRPLSRVNELVYPTACLLLGLGSFATAFMVTTPTTRVQRDTRLRMSLKQATPAVPSTAVRNILTPAHNNAGVQAEVRSATSVSTKAPADSMLDEETGEGSAGAKGSSVLEQEDRMPSTEELLASAKEQFEKHFGYLPSPDQEVAAFAPGRVNLIGEHTDYNGGFVMPLALERGTVVYGTGRVIDQGEKDATLCRVDTDRQDDGRAEFLLDDDLEPGKPKWANYVKGTAKEYLEELPKGKALSFDAFFVGTVPLGGGVSSSASLSVATATFLEGVLKKREVREGPMDPKKKAGRARAAENKFLDTPCGIMDQFVTAMAEEGSAMLLNCHDQTTTPVPLDDPDMIVVVTNSNVKHSLSGGENPYAQRVKQCQMALEALQKRDPKLENLCDATPEQVEEVKGDLEEVVYRRARHVVSENQRTLKAADALRERDYAEVGKHMVTSHWSLSEDYEVSCPELDTLVTLAMQVDGVYGSRVTGAGFGGCTVTLAKKDSVDELVRHLRTQYKEAHGVDCSCFVTTAGQGSRMLL